MEIILVLMGIIVLNATLACVVALYLAHRIARATLEMAQAVASAAVVGRTGLNPHVVDPERFAPSGMAREDEKAIREQPSPQQVEQAPDFYPAPDDSALRDAEEKWKEYIAKP